MPENPQPVSEVQNATATKPGPAPASDGSGAAANPVQVGIELAARAASQQASPGTAAPAKKRGRPPKPKLPVGDVGQGALPLPVENQGPAPDFGGVIPADGMGSEAIIDAEAEKLFVDGALDLLEIVTGTLKSLAVHRLTKDSKLSEAAFESARIPPAIRDKMQKSGALLVRKYAVDLRYAPEIAFGGALLIYAGKNAADVQKLKAEMAGRLTEPTA